MEAKTTEAEHLRKQIAFLSNLISNAKQKEAKTLNRTKGDQCSKPKHESQHQQKSLFREKAYQHKKSEFQSNAPCVHDTAKYSWRPSQPDIRPTTLQHSQKPNESRIENDVVEAANDTVEKHNIESCKHSTASLSVPQGSVSMPKPVKTKTEKISSPSAVCDMEKYVPRYKDITASPAKSVSIKKELLKTQLKILELKKSLSRHKPEISSSSSSPIGTPLRANIYNSVILNNKDMLSLSPYKLKRISSDSAISSSCDNNFKIGANLPSADSCYSSDDALIAQPSTDLIEKMPSNVTSDIHIGTASVSKLDDAQTDRTVSYLNNSHPSKLVKKTRYSLKRDNTGSTKPSLLVTESSKTPTKFISLSKYSLKRVRRSLSDENSADKTSSSVHAGHSMTRHAANMIIGKYRMYQSSPSASEDFLTTRKRRMFAYSNSRSAPYPNRRTYSSVPNAKIVNKHKGKGYSYNYNHKFRPNTRNQSWNYQRSNQGFYHQKQHSTFPKYKSSGFLQRKLEHLKRTVPFHPRMKVDHRSIISGNKTNVLGNRSAHKSTRRRCHESKVKFLSTSSSKTVFVRGVQFRVNRDGTTLKKVDTDSKVPRSLPFSQKGQHMELRGSLGRNVTSSYFHRVNSVNSRRKTLQVVNRTLQRRAIKTKQSVLKTREYCMFYNRFGRCNRGDACSYIHDPEKVAVCTRFLRGTCKVSNCSFSHKVAPEKMPVCSYFLKSGCHRENCPYLHVNVNKDAEVCPQFIKGYCPLGEKCKKKHTLECQEFRKTGLCSKGRKCTLQHRKERDKVKLDGKKLISLENSRNRASSQDTADDIVDPTDDQDDSSLNISFRDQLLPAYISLSIRSKDTILESGTQEKADPSDRKKGENKMKIRPKF